MGREVQPREKRLPDGTSMIYGLADPESGRIVYVGQTKTPGRRRWLHRSKSNNRSGRRVCRWIRSLLDAGKYPLMLELEIVSDGDAGERVWISKLAADGNRLLNMNEGGRTLEHARRASGALIKGAKRSEVHRRRIELQRAVTSFRREGRVDAAARIEGKIVAVDAAIARLEKRMGKKSAHVFLNSRLEALSHGAR